MKKHEWEKGRKDLENKYAEQHQCTKCGVYRFKWCNMWLYSDVKTTDDEPFARSIENLGCTK